MSGEVSDAAGEMNVESQRVENGTNNVAEENSGANNDENGETSSSSLQRQGTISSARFNILCTMVGGGSLSLPLAFQKTGNALFGPFLLLLTASITEFCFRMIIDCARTLSPVSANQSTLGKDSYESIASAAFGPKALTFSKWLVTAMCFFGTVGYAVLLRDMLQPITDAIAGGDGGTSGPSVANNLTMWTVVLLATPMCTLQTLSALKNLGAASMCSILILASCIVYRSLQCNFGSSDQKQFDSFQLWPDSARDVLDAFPLFVSFFVCHYNLPPVHNEMQNPTATRVSWWLRSTTWSATMFYMVMGLAGSTYAACTPTGKVQGNILLDFDEDDPLLLVGRMCLAITLTLAFPLLTVPARDILLRSLAPYWNKKDNSQSSSSETNNDTLNEPLLENNENQPTTAETETEGDDDDISNASFSLRLAFAILVFWSATAVASCVQSIDVVWDLLGSSLSILLSHLIPAGSYLMIVGKLQMETNNNNIDNGGSSNQKRRIAIWIAWLLILLYTPLMLISTVNAFENTFFKKQDEEPIHNTTTTSFMMD